MDSGAERGSKWPGEPELRGPRGPGEPGPGELGLGGPGPGEPNRSS